MKYAFDYIHSVFGHNHEVGGATLWTSIWNAHEDGELTVTHVDATTDDWETMFQIYDINDIECNEMMYKYAPRYE